MTLPEVNPVLAALAHNLRRWTLRAAGDDFDDATVGSLRRKLVAMPTRLVTSARRRWLRAPTDWPWRHRLKRALTVIAAIPRTLL